MIVEMKNAVRDRLTGQRMKIGFLDADGSRYFYDVDVESYLGEGTSCICYEVTVYKNARDIGQKRVLKQFYPDPKLYEIDTEMEGIRLDIKGYSDDKSVSWNPEINRLGEIFENAYRRQADLSNKKELGSVIVRPELSYFEGATKYVLYEADYGTCLDPDEAGTPKEIVSKMYDLACALCKLHRQGIIYMDLKPANILVSGDGKIKLLDFDAVIDLNHIEDVHMENDDIRYDMDHIGLIAPEIRPERLNEFEQDKRNLLHERVDIYSFGAIMLSFFLHRYPTEEDVVSDAFRVELTEVLKDTYRRELTEEEIGLLGHIIWKCIQKDIGPKGRYRHTEDLVRDIKNLKDLVSAPLTKREKEYKKVNGRLQAAYVMDKYPLSGYRREAADGSWIMDSLIVGNDSISEDFFINILACSQMLDTRHVIRLALSSAEDKVKEYIDQWPMLLKTTQVFVNDMPIDQIFQNKKTVLDSAVTETPFAELRFYEWNHESDLTSFYSGLKESDNISWIVVCDSSIENNMKIAEDISRMLPVREEKFFIAYLDERGDGYDLRYPKQSSEHITLFPFGSNDKFSLEESEFHSGIRKRALLLHKYYMREWNERASATAVWRDFSSSDYNIYSSLCSVLSIPYKLASVGIKTTGNEAAAEYQRIVLDECNQMARIRFNRLIYLEHRRWMCFMLTEGYDRPDDKELEEYAFRGNNDQRNKTDKLHPCICSCEKENGICLDHFLHSAWENPDFVNAANRNGTPLDGLDRMSVGFHQLCGRRIDHMVGEGEFETVFARLNRAMKEEDFTSDAYEIFDSMKNIYHKMLNNESNANHLWEKVCACFAEMLDKKRKSTRIHTGAALDEFKKLKNLMRIVVERNSYHDYKSSDRTILEVLPLLLISDDPVRRIHKPVSDKNWQNIASSLFIEPDQLYLYTDDEEFDADSIRRFLEEERGIHVDTIAVKTMDELKKLSVTKRSVKSILDITGLPAEETYRITHMDNLKDFPVIVFRDGKIHNLNGRPEVDYYKVLRRHITVGETFRSYHANIHSESSQNHMLGLISNYENIWSAYISMNSFRYKILVDTLSKIEGSHYWQIRSQKKSNQLHTFEKKRVPGAMLKDSGIDQIINELAKDQWIEDSYTYPNAGQFGSLSVKTRLEEVTRYLNRMFQIVERQPYMHRFRYIRTRREPLTQRPSSEELYYIYDDTLVVDEIVDNTVVDHENHINRDAVLEKAVNCMKFQKLKGGDPAIIEELDSGSGKIIETVQENRNQFRVRFLYRNRATKECLMKEGNILEAYVYHSIWKYAFVDDVKLNVAFTWDAEKPDDSLEKGAITNEIDLVCTRNMQTYCISCKQSMPRTEYLQEIKYFADYFGIDGKAILVTSNSGTNGKQKRNDANLISARSHKMQVYYIDRQMLGDTTAEMSRRLSGYIRNIFDGRKDWKNIEETSNK